MQELFPGTNEALNNLSLYNTETPVFEDVDAFEIAMEHFDDLKTELGYDTVWSMYDGGNMPLDFALFSDKPRVVTYKCIKEMGATMDDVTWITFTAVAENGTIGALWKAAESCFQQAKLAIGDWHIYIENFDVQEDGSLSLVTGS
tara:strand:- start:147 stop:581 length:435 start_codon:yes stop_codon:yes gene_type:complete